MEVTKKKVRRGKGSKPRKTFDPKAKANPLSSLFKDPPKQKSRPAGPPPKKTGPKQPPKAPKPKKTGEYKIIDGIQPDELFAAYHLGVTVTNGYKPQNIHDISRRFGTSPAQINDALIEYEMDAETVMNTDFDMALAQLDIKVAPKGISKIELAKNLYDEFRDAPRIVRDWASEIMSDAEENRRIFEKLK